MLLLGLPTHWRFNKPTHESITTCCRERRGKKCKRIRSRAITPRMRTTKSYFCELDASQAVNDAVWLPKYRVYLWKLSSRFSRIDWQAKKITIKTLLKTNSATFPNSTSCYPHRGIHTLKWLNTMANGIHDFKLTTSNLISSATSWAGADYKQAEEST